MRHKTIYIHSFNLELNGFQSLHISCIKGNNSKKGRKSGGISMYYKTEYTGKIFVVEKFNYGMMWIRIASELFHFKEDVYICFCNIPPTGSTVLK